MLVIVRVNGHLKFLVFVAAVASTADETPFQKHLQICMWFNVVPPTTAVISVSLTLALYLSPYLIHKDTLFKLIIGDELVCSLCARCVVTCSFRGAAVTVPLFLLFTRLKNDHFVCLTRQ